MPIQTELPYYLRCPETTVIVGRDNLQPRIKRLAGKFLAISSFAEQDGTCAATVCVSSIITALANDPEQPFWKGVYARQQLSSYGIRQHEIVDPTIIFEITADTELYDGAALQQLL